MFLQVSTSTRTYMYSRNVLQQTVGDGEGTIVAIWILSKCAIVNSRIVNLQIFILILQFRDEYIIVVSKGPTSSILIISCSFYRDLL